MNQPSSILCELFFESYQKVRFRRHEPNHGQVTGKLDIAPVCRQIAKFENLLRVDKLNRRKDFAALGTFLYRCLFNGHVADAFKQIIKEIDDSKNSKHPKKFRLQLEFSQEVDDLAGIPWEFLYYPDSETVDGFFLVDYSNLVISRYIPLEREIHSLKPEGELLTFLIVTSEPAGLQRVLKNAVIEKITNLEKDYSGIKIEVSENPTRREVQDKINIIKPHIFHFIGHGQFNLLNWEDSKGEIALVSSDKQTPIWISDSTFAECFKESKTSLVVLQTCQSGDVDFTANYAGLAPKLARKGIPAVIAMQYPVTNRIASVFSLKFYEALVKGESVDTAVQLGRKEIVYDSDNYYNNRDFGTPVLYMSARDGDIMPRPKPNKFDAEVLRNLPSELEKAMNNLFNSDELNLLLYSYDDKVYQELKEKKEQEKVKTLISKLQGEKDIKDLIDIIKGLKSEYFT